MVERLHVQIYGRVQGVGFRYATAEQAVALQLNGWVRNTADGVEAEFEGPREALEEILAWCREGPRFAQVREVEPAWSTGDPQYTTFEIHV